MDQVNKCQIFNKESDNLYRINGQIVYCETCLLFCQRQTQGQMVSYSGQDCMCTHSFNQLNDHFKAMLSDDLSIHNPQTIRKLSAMNKYFQAQFYEQVKVEGAEKGEELEVMESSLYSRAFVEKDRIEQMDYLDIYLRGQKSKETENPQKVIE